MGRPPRARQADYAYHVTVHTAAELEFPLKDEKCRDLIGSAINRAAAKFNIYVHHILLMKNHIHMIIKTPNENIDKFMHATNTMIAKRMNTMIGNKGHFLGARYFSSVMDTEVYHLRCVAYIYNNAVNAGVCNLAENTPEYYASSYQYYANGEKSFVTITPDELIMDLGETPVERQEAFVNLVNSLSPREEEDMARMIRTKQLFYGTAEWVQRMTDKYHAPKKTIPSDELLDSAIPPDK